MNALHLLPGCRIERLHRVDPSLLQLQARGVRDGACCPACGVWSEAGHGSYLRRPADLPLLGRAVQIALRVRRFRCHNAACVRRTFAQRLTGLIAPHARRTRRLAAAQGAVAVALGGEAGARLLPRLVMTTNADTLLRLIRASPLPSASVPTSLGVDDWSFKRGRTYPALAALVGSPLNLKVVRTHWDEILRLAASIKQGTVTASLILRKLGSYPCQNGLAVALREFGRIERTLFILD